MWYFTWVLGLAAAALFAVVNASWLEIQEDNKLHARLDRHDDETEQASRN